MEKRVKQLLSLACMGVFTLVMAGSGRAQQLPNVLLADPSFEQGLTAPNPNLTGLAGWSEFGGSFIQNGQALGGALDGTNVMYMPAGGGGYSVPGAYQVFAATAGQTYIFSGWVDLPGAALPPADNSFCLLQLGYFTGAPPSNYGGGTEIGSASSPNFGNPGGGGGVPLTPGVWTYMAVTGTVANAGLNHANSIGAYILDINADTAATFQFDQMSLVLVPEPSTVALVLTSLFGGGFLFLRKRRSK